MKIHTQRLELVPLGPAFLRESLDGNIAKAEQILQVPLPADWPDSADLLAMRLAQIEADPSYQPWSLRAMVLRETRVMVGHIGFHAAPGAEYLRPFSPDAVEFGFTVFPEHQRRGYAREASQALMRWAHDTYGVTKFVLSIRPDNTASQALAAGLGFVRIGSHIDEVDGLEDVLEHVWAQGT
jgi:RimJ/RimL family protein N-acetyltransferase